MSLKFKFIYLLVFCEILNFQLSFTNSCGKVQVGQGNIVSGKYALRGSYPWVAVLLNRDGAVFCGGTILTKNKVITGAHCILGKDNQYEFLPRDITVMLGAHNISKFIENGRISTGVELIDIHRNWNTNSKSFDADIALLTLTDDVAFTRYIQPICLIPPNSHLSTILSGISVGYGKSEDETRDHESVLKFIHLPIQSSNEECFYTNEALLSLSSNRTFCAGSRNSSGVCLGDSGNGLFVNHDETFYLRGIVSVSLYAANNCDTRNYAIFTNVLKFYDWIRQKIGSNEDITSTTTKKPTTTTSKPTTLKPKYQQLKPWSEPCGISRSPVRNIVGGTEVTKGTHPWIAALVNNNGKYFCGGTLISKKLVVTAAHCIYGKNSVEKTPEDFKVLLGAHELDNEDEIGRKIYLVSDIRIDRNWNPQSGKFDADIAVLKMSEEVKFGAYIQPVCLPKVSAPLTKFSYGEVVGFGKFDKSGKHSNIPRKANIPIRKTDDCYDEFPQLLNIAGHRTFSGGFANGTGACTGDSGGGLTVVEDDVHYLRGIVSASLGETDYGCNGDSYTIFTDVRFYFNFIKSVS